ncbi:hypothetical protein K3X44_11105 [Aliiroseovarius crassostreae]|uniref:hypothetical protein n=1 Tax=Aliiroseovarius crassostreae TaxID=154981 RepID=UPI002203B25C|nr:hypothetical protein [Aliiroseovarius crassostreae]UWQ01043.1 hypothetical protein K3X44_11105 [Aliiroseovarius crassostreae]
MKFALTAALLAAASPALAEGWYFDASLEGGAEFWTFTNATGEVSPRREMGDEIWIIRSDEVNELGPDGACTFDNCAVKLMLGGQVPAARERVQITFSNGETLDFEARGGEILFDNYSTAGMGATALFASNIRAAEWVEVSFGGRSHQFSLEGTAKALDAIQPYLQ